jgi:hypothetical protein
MTDSIVKLFLSSGKSMAMEYNDKNQINASTAKRNRMFSLYSVKFITTIE